MLQLGSSVLSMGTWIYSTEIQRIIPFFLSISLHSICRRFLCYTFIDRSLKTLSFDQVQLMDMKTVYGVQSQALFTYPRLSRSRLIFSAIITWWYPLIGVSLMYTSKQTSQKAIYPFKPWLLGFNFSLMYVLVRNKVDSKKPIRSVDVSATCRESIY